MSYTMNELLIISTILACTTTIQLAAAEPYPFADNVCNKSVPVRKDIITEKPVQYEIKVQSMCGILPCTKTRLETRHDQTIKTIVVHEQRTTCCDGYAETPSRQCAPICLESCNNGGKCVAPNVCKCSPAPSASAPGYVGPTCKRFACLANQRWGAACERECPTQCSANSYCSADTGKCLCYPGWYGPECALECGPDSDADDCQESDKLPPIMEPDANLIASAEQIVTSRSQQRAQALVLEQNDDADIKITSTRANEGQAWANFASSYLIGVLSLMSLIFLVAFLIVKKRYELVRNELYYASAASAVSSRSRPGPGSHYSGSSDSASSYYSAAGRPISDDIEKNQSFATATRNILSGVVAGIGGGKQVGEVGESKSKLLLFAPRIESHLIRSQKEAEQNIYSEIGSSNTTRNSRVASSVANRARAQTPVRQQPENAGAVPDDNVYAVPKSPVVSKAGDNNNPMAHDTSLEMGYDDDSSPIYEEIKPRGGSANNKQ